MFSVRISNGRSFEVAEGETLLDAALRAKITLAYSCRTGRCSTCRALVRAGSTVAIHNELGLQDSERASGWVLTCVRSATSSIDLQVNELGDVKLFPVRTIPCRIHSLERLAVDVLKVVLRLPLTSDFSFYPGQYVDVIAHEGVRRSYSIANAPSTEAHIELHIRQVPGGAMSRYWFERAKTNDLLRLNGPLGTFFLRDVTGMDLIFLATGTGIAPVKSILESLAQYRPQLGSVAVFWGGRIQADLYWNPRTTGLDHQFVPVLSRADAGWDGARGHVQQVALAQVRDWQHAAVYACGSDAMIHDARQQLVAAGLNEQRFHSDAFVCSASV